MSEGPDPTRSTPEAVSRLLDSLCVEIGFCLPPTEHRRLADNPPTDIDSFTEAVFTAEGMDYRLHRQLYKQVRERVFDAFRSDPYVSAIRP